MQTVLLTGFEPFHGRDSNPSQRIAEHLDGATISGAKIVSLTLPVVFGEDTKRVFLAIQELRPTLVLSLGLNDRINDIAVEMFAINHRKSDNSNDLIPILNDGPAAYFSTIDVDRVVNALASEDIPVHRNGYAGSYLCNHIFYQTLRLVTTQQLPCKVGFIHLPLATEQALPSEPSLPLDQITQGIRLAIAEIIGE